MKKVILLAGPTASGKSKLAIYIAKKINGEIINADSMQVFKEIKILSARPEDYKNIKHHLYGFISVKKNFSTGEWIKHTEKKINKSLKKKKTPVIVGGTGLYFKSLIDGIAQIPNISKAKRDKDHEDVLESIAEMLFSPLFQEKLQHSSPAEIDSKVQAFLA